jgi:hypothetical protein
MLDLDGDQMAAVLRTIRAIADDKRDAAWEHLAERLRCHPHVTDDDVAAACRDARELYGRTIRYPTRRAAA